MKFLNLAIKEAQKSTYKQRMGAIIFKGNSIISKGYNDPFRSVRSVSKRFLRWENTIHAEVMALLNARCPLKGTSIIVVRINNFNELRLAKPCSYCQNYLSFVGIKNCYYSTNSGLIDKL